MDNSNKNFIDAEYTEEDTASDTHINGKPIYWTTNQVSLILSESDSTIRFWCSKFKNILNIETSGTHRRFKEEDIEKLKYIKKLLREEKYSINQVIEYCSIKNEKSIEQKIQKQDPLAIQALASALSIEINNKFELLANEIRQNVSQQLTEYLDEIVTGKVNTELNDFKTYITEQNQQNQETQQEKLQIFTDSLTGMIQEHESKIDNTLNEFLSLSRMERKEMLEKHRKESNIFYKFFSKFKKSKEENKIAELKESKEDK